MTSFNVNIISDTVCSVRVDADENLMSSIRTYVRDGNLIIDTEHDRCINSGNHILIDIRMPVVDKIEQSGSGDIDVYDFECENLEISNTGSGNIDLKGITSDHIDINLVGSGSVTIAGSANSGDYSLTGSGEIYADDMMVNDCEVSISGSGDVNCYALDHLNISITGSGDVFYSGTPALIINITGSGDVHKRD
jgi:hypothetical protein